MTMTAEAAIQDPATMEGLNLYEVGRIPPLGHVPRQMYAWAIRRERHGPPSEAMRLEVVDTPPVDSQ